MSQLSPRPDPTPSVRSASEQAILLSALKDAITKAYEQGRREAIAEMEYAGSLKQLIKAVDGEELGTISHADGKWVTEFDLEQVLDWAIEHRPGEVIQPAPKLVVREPFLDWLSADAIRRAKDGQPPYPQAGQNDGTLKKVPGVKAVWKPGNVTVSANATAKGRAADILGKLFTDARGLPAQTGGTDEPGEETQQLEASPVPGGADVAGAEHARTQLVLDRLRRMVTATSSNGTPTGASGLCTVTSTSSTRG